MKAAEEAAAKKAEEHAAEIAELKRRLAAATTAAPDTTTSRSRSPTSRTPTPQPRGTPATRRPASRPSSSSQREETKDNGDDDATGQEESGDESRSSGDESRSSDDDEQPVDSQETEERDLLIARQLVERFKEQRLSPEDRTSVMGSAGEELVALLGQHWKEKSSPPEWLVSLFRPPPARAIDRELDQVNSSRSARSNSPRSERSNGGSSSPGLIFSRPRLPAARRSTPPTTPRRLDREFTTTPRRLNRTSRPSTPVAPSTPESVVDLSTSYTSGQNPKFTFRQNDLPRELVFSGKPTDPDVVEILTRYRARVKLTSVAADNPPDSVVDQRAIQFLPFVLRDAAYESLVQLTEGTLEWRSENRLIALRDAGHEIRPRAPSTWEEYCHAFTFLFSAPNRISVLAREIATIKQVDKQSVDSYALQVSQARTRLLAEAARSAPSHLSPHEHAWDVFMTATFENGLLPGIRLESIREDPPTTFQEARTRAKKHEANNLRGTSPSTPATTVSAVTTPENPQLKNTVSSNSAVIKELKAELSKLKSEKQQTKTRAASQGDSKRARTTGQTTTSAPQEKCPYPFCKFSHTIDKCALKKKHEEMGITWSGSG